MEATLNDKEDLKATGGSTHRSALGDASGIPGARQVGVMLNQAGRRQGHFHHLHLRDKELRASGEQKCLSGAGGLNSPGRFQHPSPWAEMEATEVP